MQVLGPIGKDEEISVLDVQLLERLAAQRGAKKVAETIRKLDNIDAE